MLKNDVVRKTAVFLLVLLLIAAASAWIRFSELKKSLITKISERAGSAFGQRLAIGDISFSALTGITVHDIALSNPEGFPEGDLLRIKRLGLSIRYRELFRRQLSFDRIEMDSLVVSILKDKTGAVNVSEKLRALFSGKGTLSYRVDELSVRKGGISFSNSPLYNVSDIEASLADIASEGSPRSRVRASGFAAGNSRIELDGWIFLKDEAKSFGLTIRSGEVGLALFSPMLAGYGLDPDKSSAEIKVVSEGDMKHGVLIGIEGRLRTGPSGFISKMGRTINISSDLFIDPARDRLVLKRIEMTKGREMVLHMSGSVSRLLHDPEYAADIIIKRLDLSAFNFIKGLNFSGTVASQGINIHGSFQGPPHVSGTLDVSEGALSSEAVEMRQVSAAVTFSLEKELSLNAKISSRVIKAGGVMLRRPPDMSVSVEASGRPEAVRLSSKVTLSDAEASIGRKAAALKSLALIFEGNMRGRNMDGMVSADIQELAYEDLMLKKIKAGFELQFDGAAFNLKHLNADSEKGEMSADSVSFIMPVKKKPLEIVLKELGMREETFGTAVKGLDLEMTLDIDGNNTGGSGVFIAKGVEVYGINSGNISGACRFDRSGFELDLKGPDFLKGRLQFSARGRTEDGPFPVQLDLRAEELDIGRASGTIKKRLALPYDAAGRVGLVTFMGEAVSASDIRGSAHLSVEKGSLADAEKRSIFRDASITADMTFKGKDMVFTAEAMADGISAKISGSAERFLDRDRSMSIRLSMPEVKPGDIRTVFWDIMPDSLLYAGMDGSMALDLLVSYGRSGMTADGKLQIRGLMLSGENNEYSVGPVNGMLPLHYSSDGSGDVSHAIPVFEKDGYEELKKTFYGPEKYYGSEISIGSVRYGFRFMDNISLRVVQKGRALNINHISANMFGGRLYGAAVVEYAQGLAYRAGMLADGISLTSLCDEIIPIKGYLSGRINGIAALKGRGANLNNIIGKADLWTYSDSSERTLMSREFLEKLGGPQVKAYLGERKFDRGIMSLYIQDGDFIFNDLEISNRNFIGMTDLMVKVAPLNNRVSIDHLLWTITTAAQRARKE